MTENEQKTYNRLQHIKSYYLKKRNFYYAHGTAKQEGNACKNFMRTVTEMADLCQGLSKYNDRTNS